MNHSSLPGIYMMDIIISQIIFGIPDNKPAKNKYKGWEPSEYPTS
jgi:hypothetical protein